MTVTSGPWRIVAAALLLDDGTVLSRPPPARHLHLAQLASEQGCKPVHPLRHGFLTDDGEFVFRDEACIIATRAGQIKDKCFPKDKLYSEDLW